MRHRILSVALVVAVPLALAACTAAPPVAAPAPTPTVTATGPDLDACLVGEWTAGTQTGDLTGEASGTWQTLDENLVSTVDQTDVLLRKSLGGDPEPFNGVNGWENIPIAVSEVTCDGDNLEAAFNLINTSFPMELTRQG